MSDARNVTVAKPKIGGAIWRAPLGTELPTSATDELNEAFKSLGYIDEAGLTNATTRESQEIKAWGGDTVNNAQTSYKDTFKYKLIEALNIEVLKTVYGDANVSGNLETGITLKANSQEQKECAWVVDMIMKDGILKRIVVPQAKITEVAEIQYVDGAVVGYDSTMSAVPDTAGNYHYEYVLKA